MQNSWKKFKIKCFTSIFSGKQQVITSWCVHYYYNPLHWHCQKQCSPYGYIFVFLPITCFLRQHEMGCFIINFGNYQSVIICWWRKYIWLYFLFPVSENIPGESVITWPKGTKWLKLLPCYKCCFISRQNGVSPEWLRIENFAIFTCNFHNEPLLFSPIYNMLGETIIMIINMCLHIIFSLMFSTQTWSIFFSKLDICYLVLLPSNTSYSVQTICSDTENSTSYSPSLIVF